MHRPRWQWATKCHSAPSEHQYIWSLTQFYSVDFSHSTIMVKKGFLPASAGKSRLFRKQTIKFVSVVFGGILGLRQMKHLMMPFFHCGSRNNAPSEVECPWRALCKLKKPFKSLRQRWGELQWGTEENNVSQRRVIDLPLRQNNDFSQYWNRKILS